MPSLVFDTAELKCSLGDTTGKLAVQRRPGDAAGLKLACIADHTPNKNIPSFGRCRSPNNPAVAAATAAAGGVLTPQQCVPATNTPWTQGSSKVDFEDVPVLTQKSTCECRWGGSIQVVDPAHDTVVEV